MSGRTRHILVEIDRIGFAGGLGEELQESGFDLHRARFGDDADMAIAIDHHPAALPYSVTTQAPPSPTLCCKAKRMFSTCRASAVPRNWCVSS